MTRRSACWCATDARPWRRYFSTSRAAAAKHARPRNERAVDQCRDLGAASHRRDGAALCLPLALILDPACRADLLAGGPTLGVGFSAVLYRPEFRFFARASGVFIAAVLMWDVLFRGQLGFSVS